MKQRILMTAMGVTLAAMASNASAVALNPKGLGQVLIYPYYTVNKGQDTLLSVVNTSDVGKVVRVRFLEGYNGREVLSFLVLLSSRGVWTAAVTAAGHAETGPAVLVTHDRSCTIPAIPAEGQKFTETTYTGRNIAPYNVPDSGPQTVERTREGHIEVVANGDIIPDSPLDKRIRHVQTGTPGTGTPQGCDGLRSPEAWLDMVVPTNTLAGSVGIVNVAEGTYYPYDADALSDFTDFLLNAPDVFYDDLSHANSAQEPSGAAATVFTDGGMVTQSYSRGIDAVSAVFMAESIYNEIQLNPSLSAATDWILTFPTKRFYVDAQAYAGAPRAPFTEAFTNGESKVTIGYRLYDTEEMYVSDPCGTICGVPPPQPPLTSPYEVNVVAFRRNEGDAPTTTSSVFGSRLAKNLSATIPGWVSGWADLDLARDEDQALPPGTEDGKGAELRGLPVTGFTA